MKEDKLKTALLADPHYALELLSLAYERISHKLRTPLGTAMSVLDDWRNGASLGEQDFEDAASSLKAVVSFLNLLKMMSMADSFVPEETKLLEVLRQIQQSAGGQQVKLNFNAVGGDAALRVDPVLFAHAVECFLSYMCVRNVRCAKGVARDIEIRLTKSGNREGISISWDGDPAMAAGSCLGKASTALEMALLDQNAEALGLIYMEAVAALHKGSTEIKWDNPGRPELVVYFC
jgi:hypothetical protein